MTVRVKICGLTRREDAAEAERAGAAYLGVILAGGPRLVTLPQANHVLGPARHGVDRVAVFGDQPADEIIAVAEALALDVIQLHGARSARDVEHISRRSMRTVWPVLRIAGCTLPPDAAEVAAVGQVVVLDAHVVGQLGGTGVALDWSGLAGAVADLRAEVPGLTLVLAGGLRAANVREAIQLLAPEVVDVSSGVERAPGVKDPAQIERFVLAAHDAAEKSL